MKIKTSLLVLILLIALFSCNKHSESKLYEFFLEDPPPKEVVPLSSICEEIQYIPIETQEAIIGSIGGVRYSNGKFAIESGNEIFLIDNSGELIFLLSKQGRGPDEYSSTTEFDLDNDGTEILVYDSGKGRIVGYNIAGDVVNEIKPVSGIDYLKCLSNERIFLYSAPIMGANKFSHSVINFSNDTLWSLRNKFIFEPGVVTIFKDECISYTKGSSYYYREMMDDTLYCLDSDLQKRPYAVFNTGQLRFSVEKRTDVSLTGRPEAIFLTRIVETLNHFIIMYGYKGAQYCISEKSTGITKLLKNEGFTNDLDGGMPFFPDLQIEDDYLIQVVDAYKFNMWLENEHFNSFAGNEKLKAKFRNLAEMLSENENPVIIKCKLK